MFILYFDFFWVKEFKASLSGIIMKLQNHVWLWGWFSSVAEVNVMYEAWGGEGGGGGGGNTEGGGRVRACFSVARR